MPNQIKLYYILKKRNHYTCEVRVPTTAHLLTLPCKPPSLGTEAEKLGCLPVWLMEDLVRK